MNSRGHRIWPLVGSWVGVWILISGPAVAQNQPPDNPQSQEEVIERILALKLELDSLLETLDPALRGEVERRYRELIEQAAEKQAPPEPITEPEAPPITAPPAPPEPTAEVPEEAGEAAHEPTVVERLFEDEEAPVDPATLPQGCGTLAVLDTNQDGLVSGADRYWRYLRLWFDTGDSVIQDDEIESMLEHEIRSFSTDLRYFQMPEKVTGDLSTDDLIRFHLLGKQAVGTRPPALVVQAGRLSRSGEVVLIDAEGQALTGFQPLGSGTRLELGDGSEQPLFCP